MLVAGEMGRNKDLSDFDNDQIAMARRLVRVCLKMQGLCVAPGPAVHGENLPTMV